MAPRRFSVGIDLGTTHTVVARGAVGGTTEIFPIAQLTSRSHLEELPLLPSVLYAPVAGEEVADPFGEPPFIVGEWARRRGREVPGRAITSAKSWLCHAGVDRESPILPWSRGRDGALTDEATPQISPIEASARILRHVRRAYNAAFPDEPLERAQITLTVPASFDEVARSLTLRAAAEAGLDVRLLEEPQAAFYDFLSVTGTKGLLSLVDDAGGELLSLVCDVGGGTTDLSILAMRRKESEPHGLEVERLSVGNHLLVGGDNMDIALAHATEAAVVGEGPPLDPTSFEQWVMGCREAKEVLLGEGAPDTFRVSLATRGSALVGGTRSANIEADATRKLVLEGFFPRVAGQAEVPPRRSAVVAFGLPYERDVAITRHIVQFLQRHADGRKISAVLLNGGVLRSKLIAQRIEEVVSMWNGAPVRVLDYPHPDHAVARGAVAYGLSLLGQGLRIGGGTSRGYYIGIESGPGARRKAVCVVPRGSLEGERHVVQGRTFVLTVGRTVRFDLYSSDSETPHSTGDVVAVTDETFQLLPPLAIRVAAEGGESARTVHLEGELSAVGTLDLACVANDTGARSRLEFQLGGGAPVEREGANALGDVSRALILGAFGKPKGDASGREAKDLLRQLEVNLGERSGWSLGVARSLFDVLIPLARGRRRSLDHERVFFLLAGYCLRPGFGCAGDEDRAQAMAALIDQRLAFPNEPRGWTQFWIAWRRVAPGLDEAAQLKLRDVTDPWIMPADKAPKKGRKGAMGSPNELLEIASFLERVPQERRSELGGWILEKTWTSRDPALWTALGRIGARVPSYASAHYVVSPLIVERWIDHALREKWTDLPAAARAAALLARMTGDRGRDVPVNIRKEVARKLSSSGSDPALIQLVTEIVPMKETERVLSLGDSLPMGLRLSDDAG